MKYNTTSESKGKVKRNICNHYYQGKRDKKLYNNGEK